MRPTGTHNTVNLRSAIRYVPPPFPRKIVAIFIAMAIAFAVGVAVAVGIK